MLSINDCWQGRRFKTKQYKEFERAIILMLKPVKIPEGSLEIHITWGFSSAGSDYDNPIKPFQDCLQKKYGFNDNRIKRAIIDCEKVKKGDEFIEWELKKLEGK